MGRRQDAQVSKTDQGAQGRDTGVGEILPLNGLRKKGNPDEKKPAFFLTRVGTLRDVVEN